MMYRTADEILDETKRRGMRRAFVLTALLLEMKAVRAHLADMGSVLGRHGTIYKCGSFTDRGQDWLIVVAESGAAPDIWVVDAPTHTNRTELRVSFLY